MKLQVATRPQLRRRSRKSWSENRTHADSAFVADSTLWQLQAKRRNRKSGRPPEFSKSC